MPGKPDRSQAGTPKEYRYGEWGFLVDSHLRDKGLTQKWLVDQINKEIGRIGWRSRVRAPKLKTFQARVRGELPPPDELVLKIVADVLQLQGEKLYDYYGAVGVDIWHGHARQAYPSYADEQLDQLLLATADWLARKIAKRTRRASSAFWLPFVMQQLEPYRFAAHKLAISEEKAFSITIPPTFSVPTDGKPEYEMARTVAVTQPLAEPVVARLQQGWKSEEELIAILSEQMEYEPGAGDSIWTGGDGRLHLRLVTDAPALSYACPEGTPVQAITDGVVTLIPTAVHPDRQVYGVQTDTLSGYEIAFNGLSQVKVVPGQAVKRGETIGLAGHTGQRFEWAHTQEGQVTEHLVGERWGVVITCWLKDGHERSVAAPSYVDPGILIPVAPRSDLSVSEGELAAAVVLNRHEEPAQPFCLAEITQAAGGVGVLSWTHYIAEPYVVLPDNETLAHLSVGALLVASMPFWLWQGLRRRRR